MAGDPQRGPSVDGTLENKNSRSDICYLEAGIQVLFHKGAVNAPSSQLTEEQIESIIKREKFNSIKDCMTFFKELHKGCYDGKTVSNIYNLSKD